ncbi:MAG: hypothetical protein JXR83_00040 [Deltaproteobacteria bacterium]|nr:hypothetical protein [Deltaproteobacteria bacterium]
MREELLAGQYQPLPVRRQLIPKSGDGMRELGIPTVLDRFIQQALLQVLQPCLDPTFSKHSYGFRPGRSAHQAILAAQRYVQAGRSFVVDVDLEKFFDRVNHDVLMGRLAKRVDDKLVLGLILRYLEAGVMIHGVVQERYEGTPQGGPLSPLLANILLDEATTGAPYATCILSPALQFLSPMSNRFARKTRCRRHKRVATVADRPGLCRGPKSTPAFVQQWRNVHVLLYYPSFRCRVAPHASVRSLLDLRGKIICAGRFIRSRMLR